VTSLGFGRVSPEECPAICKVDLADTIVAIDRPSRLERAANWHNLGCILLIEVDSLGILGGLSRDVSWFQFWRSSDRLRLISEDFSGYAQIICKGWNS
jgi:hypothetical protein